MDAIETIKHKGFTIEIFDDPDISNPREDECMGRIATVHLSRYRLKDDREDYLPEDLGGWAEVEDYLRLERGAQVVLPLYLYDHSVQSVSTESFVGRAHHADWDSGQIGFIYANRADINRFLVTARLTKDVLARAERILREEVQAFDYYVRGEGYGYKVTDKHGEEIGSCWGYNTIKGAVLAAKGDIKAELGYSQGYKVKEA